MEGFNDLIEEINKQGGQLMWITQKKTFLENKNNRRRTPDQIKQDVLQSARLSHCIDQLIAKDNALTKETIQTQAKIILDEMAHQFDLKYVRMLGYILIKVFTKIYKHIYYNSDIINNLQVVKNYPTLFLPLHRSYMDFLLVSIICFHKNIQLPTIATGQDFLGLSFLSEVIRRTGAFFIRRSFGSDQLYWSIFHEYVQQHMLNCDRPIEFFIEGMRSRTSKSLRPKFGMLSSCLETFMKGHRVEDIYLVPISLTYERLLEEILYSNELLGIPKPKETVSGLVKARTILNQSFGSIFVNFSRPISVREILHRLSGPNLTNRTAHTLTPSFIFELTTEQNKSIESLSYSVLIEMQRQQIIQPISLIATCILYANEQNVNLDQLCLQVKSLKRLLNNLGVKVYWPLIKNDKSELEKAKSLILENIESHPNLFILCNDSNVVKQTKETNYLKINQPIDIRKALDKTSIFENASIYLAVCSYKNQLVNFLVRISFVCNCFLASSNPANILQLNKQTDTITYDMYKFLTVLFNYEFIFRENDDKKDFNDAVGYLLHTNLIRINEDGITYELVKFNLKNFLFLASLFQSCMNNYLEIYSVLFSVNSTIFQFEDEKQITKVIQQKLFDKITSQNRMSFDYECLSLNLISNSILSLKQFDILKKMENISSNSKLNYEINLSLLKNIIFNKLNFLIEKNQVRLKNLNEFDLNQNDEKLKNFKSKL